MTVLVLILVFTTGLAFGVVLGWLLLGYDLPERPHRTFRDQS